ncbi:MAG: MarR family transcriptional regulator [Chrysiogenales bacterium]|nr:MAG: MarR family transcriptional regulator [Chrysiogenales bacterium]
MEIENHSDSTFNSYSLQQDQIRQIIYQIRRLMQAGYQYTKELNKNYQVSAPQLNCLIALYEKGPLPPSQIARQIMVNSSTLTGVIDRLEFKGFVTRTRNSPDRRVITIELTEAGKTLAQNAPPPIQKTIVDGLKRLTSDQLDQIIHNIGLLTHMLDVREFDSEHPEESHLPL